MLETLAAALALAGGAGYLLALAISAAMRVARASPMRWRPPWWALIALGTALAALVFERALGRGFVLIGSRHGGDSLQSVGAILFGLVLALAGAWRGAEVRWRAFGEFDWSKRGATHPSAFWRDADEPATFRGNAWSASTSAMSAGATEHAPSDSLSQETRERLAQIESPVLRARLEKLMAGRDRPGHAERMAIARINAAIGIGCAVVGVAIVVAFKLAGIPPGHPMQVFVVPAAFLCGVGAVVAFARAAWYAMRV